MLPTPPAMELLEGKDGKYYPRSRTGDLEAELAAAKTDAVRQDIVQSKHLLENSAPEGAGEARLEKIASKWGVTKEHVEEQAADITDRGPRPRDFGEETMAEIFVEAYEGAFGTPEQIRAKDVRAKMRELADLVTGYAGKKGGVAPEAAAEAVVEWYLRRERGPRRRFDEQGRSQVRTDIQRYKQLCEWIPRFVLLLEETLEKRLAVEHEVSELRHTLQEDEGISPPPP